MNPINGPSPTSVAAASLFQRPLRGRQLAHLGLVAPGGTRPSDEPGRAGASGHLQALGRDLERAR